MVQAEGGSNKEKSIAGFKANLTGHAKSGQETSENLFCGLKRSNFYVVIVIFVLGIVIGLPGILFCANKRVLCFRGQSEGESTAVSSEKNAAANPGKPVVVPKPTPVPAKPEKPKPSKAEDAKANEVGKRKWKKQRRLRRRRKAGKLKEGKTSSKASNGEENPKTVSQEQEVIASEPLLEVAGQSPTKRIEFYYSHALY